MKTFLIIMSLMSSSIVCGQVDEVDSLEHAFLAQEKTVSKKEVEEPSVFKIYSYFPDTKRLFRIQYLREKVERFVAPYDENLNLKKLIIWLPSNDSVRWKKSEVYYLSEKKMYIVGHDFPVKVFKRIYKALNRELKAFRKLDE